MEKGRRLLQDYDAVMDKVAEAEELNLSGKPSTLEKLAALAKCDAPECNPTVCRKARNPFPHTGHRLWRGRDQGGAGGKE